MQETDAAKHHVKPMLIEKSHEGHGNFYEYLVYNICHEAESEQGCAAPSKNLNKAGLFDMAMQ